MHVEILKPKLIHQADHDLVQVAESDFGGVPCVFGKSCGGLLGGVSQQIR